MNPPGTPGSFETRGGKVVVRNRRSCLVLSGVGGELISRERGEGGGNAVGKNHCGVLVREGRMGGL